MIDGLSDLEPLSQHRMDHIVRLQLPVTGIKILQKYRSEHTHRTRKDEGVTEFYLQL